MEMRCTGAFCTVNILLMPHITNEVVNNIQAHTIKALHQGKVKWKGKRIDVRITSHIVQD